MILPIGLLFLIKKILDEDTSQLNRTKRTLRKRTADTSSPSRTEPLSKRKSGILRANIANWGMY